MTVTGQHLVVLKNISMHDLSACTVEQHPMSICTLLGINVDRWYSYEMSSCEAGASAGAIAVNASDHCLAHLVQQQRGDRMLYPQA